ncbi:hypothetical protein [Parasulfitobacter algicola]|uniref:Uncharacterized protein n=1 Tax=Parasulfitobacter algicola TaxID=2614809 RepID=A0ABX2IVI3_9RHOB|nr:hypothetical protein [Sulfitobacter algicola]NSX56941.1 hypothetical protein [Sulfitobacter algicola]
MSDNRTVLSCKHVAAGKEAIKIENDDGYLSTRCGCGVISSAELNMNELTVIELRHVFDGNLARTHLANAQARFVDNEYWEFNSVDNKKAKFIPAGAKWMLGLADFEDQFFDVDFYTLQKDNGEIGKMYSQSGYEMIAFWSDLEAIEQLENTSPVAVTKIKLTLSVLNCIDKKFGCFLVNPDANDYQRIVTRSQLERKLI